MKTTMLNTTNFLSRSALVAVACLGALSLAAQPQGQPQQQRPGQSPQQNNARPKQQPQARPAPVQTLPRGYVDVVHGNDHFYNYRGVFYQRGTRGYVVVRPPIGLRIVTLPLGFARIFINNALFYRYNDVYYQPIVGGGYVVVNTPVGIVGAVVSTPTPAPVVVTSGQSAVVVDNSNDYQEVWVGNVQYHFKNGQFFQHTADGYVWVAAPVGAITPTLPSDATSVWYQDIEYYDCDNVYFRKTPSGFMVVSAPWQTAN